ncbi:hypothetical protein PoB_001601600 [Plakobranchus ocellatus]|uniref:Uncharacterized protein n=1 Tax=Plakobranchus ocellatus TaxID=259542 RepID=A0AAV3YQT6_9GAST|nr:hypothetical protein PoB_001601600 [Plakobranchus ocellatus]
MEYSRTSHKNERGIWMVMDKKRKKKEKEEEEEDDDGGPGIKSGWIRTHGDGFYKILLRSVSDGFMKTSRPKIMELHQRQQAQGYESKGQEVEGS